MTAWNRGIFRLWVLPGSVLTPPPRRSPLLPWTAPRAWPGSSSPSTGTPGLSSDGWSTFHPSYWHHPEHNSSRVSERASHLWNQTDSMHNESTHLPHGFNTLLEEVEVTMARQIAWPDHVTIETPELLHLEKKKKCLHQQLWAACIHRFGLRLAEAISTICPALTYRGEAANLLNVLFVALSTGWSPWGASGVPEGVVVL